MKKFCEDLAINNSSLSFFKDKNKWLEHYQNNGIAVEHSLIDHEFCSDLIKDAYEINKPGIYSPIMMPHKYKDSFRKFMNHPRIISILQYLIKTKVYGLKIGIVRCGNLYGPGDFNKNRIIFTFTPLIELLKQNICSFSSSKKNGPK